jgi:hypothetical protein
VIVPRGQALTVLADRADGHIEYPGGNGTSDGANYPVSTVALRVGDTLGVGIGSTYTRHRDRGLADPADVAVRVDRIPVAQVPRPPHFDRYRDDWLEGWPDADAR